VFFEIHGKEIDDAKPTSLIYRWVTVRGNYLQMGHGEKGLFADGISIKLHGRDLQMVRVGGNNTQTFSFHIIML
jgi:hypothetical protein